MVSVAAATFSFALVALIAGAVRFWKGTASAARVPGARARGGARSSTWPRCATWAAAATGATSRTRSSLQARRVSHHALFYGFALCFASTTVAALYDHGLGRLSPFPFASLPVLLGTVGGLGMTVGTAGMLWFKFAADPEPGAPRLLGTDFALHPPHPADRGDRARAPRPARDGAMGTLLAVHLGCVLALFVVMPYSKFVHGIYRGAALLRNAVEQARPPRARPEGRRR